MFQNITRELVLVLRKKIQQNLLVSDFIPRSQAENLFPRTRLLPVTVRSRWLSRTER